MYILVFLFTILILVVIHEFGHFIMAKKFGIKVLEFGFGLPPRAWGKKVGETLISINWLPFGGFVKLLGEDEEDPDVLKMERSFAHQKVGKKIAVVVAGVVMNLLLAWIIFYGVLIAQNFKIIYPSLEPVLVIDHTEKGFPAENSGILEGDRILSVNDKKVINPEDAISIIKNTPKDKSVKVTVTNIDGGNKREINIIPKEISPGDKKIGIAFSPFPFKQYKTPTEKMFSGILYSWDATRYTFLGLGNLFNDLIAHNFQKASQSVAGPVGLAVLTKDIVSIGRDATLFYLWFVGIMSLTLAIFNVLPIPALDGGRLFFLLVEALTGKKTNPSLERTIHTIGFALLITLIIVITFSDLSKTNFVKSLFKL